MNRYIVLMATLFVGVVILIGCHDENASNNQHQNDEEANDNHNNNGNKADNHEQSEGKDSDTEASVDMVVKTDDGKVTFTLKNEIEASEETMETLKKRVLDAYDFVKESIDTPYTPEDEINIFFKKGIDISSGIGGNITLYGREINEYPIIHEMTHAILGYGGKDGKLFDATRGFLTQEGFADYLQDERGTFLTQSRSDFYMKILLNEDKVFPLTSLIDPVTSQKYFRPSARKAAPDLTMSLSYIHAGSFVHFLIEEYGIDKFEKVYNQEDLKVVLEEIYKRNVSDLEKDWHAYIEGIEKNLIYDNYEEGNVDELIGDVDSIDSDMFK